MIIDFFENDFGQSTIRAKIDNYDGYPPVSEVYADVRLAKMTPDRVALAAYLLFGRFAGGAIEFNLKISPLLAATLTKDAHPLFIQPGPVEYYPKPIPRGIGTFTVCTTPTRFPSAHDNVITILPSHLWNGRLRSHHGILCGSNAFMLQNSPDDLAPALAIAVLLAEDVNADTLNLCGPLPTAEERARFSHLLSAAGLGLAFVEED